MHDVGDEVAHDVVERDSDRLAGLEPRPHVERAGRGQGPVVLAHHEADLVVVGEGLDDTEHPGVGPAAVGQPVGDVQDAHAPGEDSPPHVA